MEPVIRDLPAIRIAGVAFQPDVVGWDKPPAAFYQLAMRPGDVTGRVPGSPLYGYIRLVDGALVYLAGVEVDAAAELPAGVAGAIIPAHRYACFEVRGGLAAIGDVYHQINHVWTPASGYTQVPGAVEVYGPEFGPTTDCRFEIRAAIIARA